MPIWLWINYMLKLLYEVFLWNNNILTRSFCEHIFGENEANQFSPPSRQYLNFWNKQINNAERRKLSDNNFHICGNFTEWADGESLLRFDSAQFNIVPLGNKYLAVSSRLSNAAMPSTY